MNHDGTKYKTIRERIESELVDPFLDRLSDEKYGRKWLGNAGYSFSFDDSVVSSEFEEHTFGESAYSYKVIAYSEEELALFIDRICKRVEKSLAERLGKITGGKVSYNEGPLSVDLDYRFVKITFRYSILEW